jgi:hypothetical protein
LGERCKNRGEDVYDDPLVPDQLSFQGVPHNTSDFEEFWRPDLTNATPEKIQEYLGIVKKDLERQTEYLEGLKGDGMDTLPPSSNPPIERANRTIAFLENEIERLEKRLDKEDDGHHHNNPNYDEEWSAKYDWSPTGEGRVESKNIDWGWTSDEDEDGEDGAVRDRW